MQIGTIYKADDTTKEIRPAKGGKLSLKQLQRAVNGNIEQRQMAPGNGHAKMFLNVYGRRLHLPYNMHATALLHPRYCACVVGDAVVVHATRRAQRRTKAYLAARIPRRINIRRNRRTGRGGSARVLSRAGRNHG
jgi:hypothetical protein